VKGAALFRPCFCILSVKPQVPSPTKGVFTVKHLAVLSSIILVAYILTGCSTGRAYHDSNNPWKLGYSDTQLSEKVYRISYAGYGIPQNECDDYALLRAADISKSKGSAFFKVLNEQQTSSIQTHYIPGQTYTTGTYGYGRVNATSFSTGMSFSANYPVSTFTIQLLGDNNEPGSMDAEIIWSSLAKKHSVN
jgi:hypothetical protein